MVTEMITRKAENSTVINAFAIKMRGYCKPSIVNAATAAKAKYAHYLCIGDIYEDFRQYLSNVESCTRLSFVAKHVAAETANEDFRRTALYRGVPQATPGMEVELRGERGYIVGANDTMNFDVAFPRGVWNCHPNYELVYFADDGSILYDFRTTKSAEQ